MHKLTKTSTLSGTNAAIGLVIFARHRSASRYFDTDTCD